jgi:membrane associated rhomboid family serine protease
MSLSITLIIIIVTVLVSMGGFNNQKIIDDLIFYPPAISRRNQWYRFFSCGLIHADWGHLIFNMYALFIFGIGQSNGREPHLATSGELGFSGPVPVEFAFKDIFGQKAGIFYLLMYIAALAICLLPTYFKNKDNYHYRSLGASGAVSAVIFSYVMLNPLSGMGLLFIPIFIPSFLFAIIYLAVSSWLAKRGTGNINHSAHIWGAIFGIVFLVVAAKLFGSYPVLEEFIDKIRNADLSQLVRFGY